MPESDERLSEPLGDRILVHLVLFEMLFPERERSLCDGKRRGGHLTRSGPPGLAAVRERCHDGARLQVGVRVVQVIDRNRSVHKNGLFRHAQPHYLREKIHVFLCAARASRNVMVTGQGIFHSFSSVNWKMITRFTNSKTGSQPPIAATCSPDLECSVHANAA